MDGVFTVNDKDGKIIFASSPGMKTSLRSTFSSKNPKNTVKKTIKPLISIFHNLSESDIDPNWALIFNKMSIYKFPNKFSWTQGNDPNFYGTLLYKNRQLNKTFPIPVDWDIEDIRHEVKKFINTFSYKESDNTLYQLKKPLYEPVPWKNIKIREQEELIDQYVSIFALENRLTKEEAKRLSLYILLYSINKNLENIMDYDGTIIHIQGIYKDQESGHYKIKGV